LPAAQTRTDADHPTISGGNDGVTDGTTNVKPLIS
jgi:hypothetical protein